MTQTMSNNDIVVDQCWYDKAKAYLECPVGWQHIARQVEAVLLAEGCDVQQMKEKFGELRVYYIEPEEWDSLTQDGYEDKLVQIDTLIEIADHVCQRTCMDCGSAGKQHVHFGWIEVLCDEHWNELNKGN